MVKTSTLIQKDPKACFVPGPVQALGIEQWKQQQKSSLWWNLYFGMEDKQNKSNIIR